MSSSHSAFSIQHSAFLFNQEPSSPRRSPSTAEARNSGKFSKIRIQNSEFRIRSAEGAFTLIELVVVILIITTLAALLFTGASSTFDRARKTQAKNDLTQLLNAVNAFYTEYGQYPCAANTGADSNDYLASNDATNAAILDVLRVPSANALNPRGIVFLAVPSVKNSSRPAGGIGTIIRAWYDPWGTSYRFRIDSNYNNTLMNPYSANAGPSTINLGCAGWSLGKNLTGGTGDKNASASADDVLSW